MTVKTRVQFLQEVKKVIPADSVCVEIGVLDGTFSDTILDVLKPKVLHLVDPWEVGSDKNAPPTYGQELGFLQTSYSTPELYQMVQERFEEQIGSGQVVTNRKFSYDAVQDYPDGYFDFVYIDACHLYESVIADMRSYLPKLKHDGLLCGHDFMKYDNFGVIRAVAEFMGTTDFGYLIFNENEKDWALSRRGVRP